MYDQEDGGEFYGGEPDGPVELPYGQPSFEQKMRARITGASFIGALLLTLLEVVLALGDASCGAQIATTGGIGVCVGILLPSAASWFVPTP